MTPNAFIRELAQALTRQEDLTNAEAQQVLYELALRIYALLLATLPATSVERQLRWPAIRRQLLPLLLAANAQLATLLITRLEATEPLVLRTNERFFRLPPDSLPPRPTPTLLSTTSVVGTSLEALFTASPTTGLSPFVAQLLRLLERSIFAAVFREASTPEVAAALLTPTLRAGTTTLVARKGTVANAWRERFRSIVAAALWGLVTPAQLRAAEALPPEAKPTEWRWNAVLDPRTCPICRPLHNTVAPAPSAFPRGAPPLHPLCVLGSTEVSTGGLLAATRAFYSGNVVTIRTQSGSEVSVTAQHPMLTSRGWVRAELLLNGDQLLRHTLGAPASADLPDLHHRPTQAQEVFEAFISSGGVSTACVPPAPMHFHGDGGSYQRDIEVVWAHGQLKDGGPADLFQAVGQLNRVRGDSHLPSKPSPGYLDLLFFAANAASCGLVGLCSEALALLRGGIGHADVHRLASASRSHPRLLEPVYEDVASASIGLGQLLDALPGLVALDQVLDINLVAVHDLPVYDFTTSSGIYSVGNLISHNCRCMVLPE